MKDNHEGDLLTGFGCFSFLWCRWVGDPESLLINGKGNFTCTTTKKWGSCQGLEVIQVEPDKTYYLRLIGVQSLDMIDFAIEVSWPHF